MLFLNFFATACDTEYIVTLEEAHALVNAGYIVIGRTLFYQDGILARNTTIDGLSLDSNGFIIYNPSTCFAAGAS